ncbi:dynein light chain Tctex-type 5-B-like [Glandiceps talaboti]
MSLTAGFAQNMTDVTLDRNTSSLFEIARKPRTTGSSYVSLSCEPSHDGDFQRKPKLLYENSYRMEPTKKFISDRVEPVIQAVLEENLASEKYDGEKCSLLSKTISQEIKLRIKDLHYDRFKIVCTVSIGEKKSQDVLIGSRCVWDQERDDFASASYTNSSLFAIAVVYALYYE